MPEPITIQAGGVTARAELNDSPTAAAIREALPIEADASTWGDEVYFAIGVSAEADADARRDMAVGELGYWPPGKAMCIFFGPTPASDASGGPKAASEVNPIGRIVGDAAVFRAVKDGDKILIEAAAEG